MNIIRLLLYQPLYNLLIFLIWLIPGHSLGWAIVLLTFLIRLALYPSFKKTIEHQKKIGLLKPHLDQIKQDHQGDQKLQAEKTMELYRQHGVSPFSACLPQLIQLPILIVLYYVLIAGVKEIQPALLYSFTPRPDTLSHLFFGLDLTARDRIFLPIIAGALQFLQSWQIFRLQKSSPGEKSDFQSMFSKQMMYFFPLMTVFIAASLPAALPLYWAATTLFSIIQQWWVFRQKGETAVLAAPVSSEGEKGIEETKEKKDGVEITVREK
ncbi:membrane protein insertase YidC [Candidatus Berkelbacteria bacterium]|nr:membrane protein insertase YidC [Candidatus Berkelbacteria bacterium]